MANLDQIQLPDNTTYDIISKTGRGLVRATMNDTTSTSTAFVVEASGISALYDGLTIVVKNTKIASASGCTLQLNNLAAKSIWLSQSNSACTTHWALNAAHIFIYDATNERWELQQGRDRDTEYIDYEEYEDLPEELKNNGKAYYINNIPNNGYKTVSGAVCSFSDGADDVPMPSVKASITAVQAGSGDPSPSNVRAISGFAECDVVHTGANLFNKDTGTLGVWVSAQGVESSNLLGYMSEFIEIHSNLVLKCFSTTSLYLFGFAEYDKNGVFIARTTATASSSVNSVSLTPNQNTAKIKVLLSTPQGTANTQEYIDSFKAVLSPTTPTTYESYAGETIPVWMGGVNLWGGGAMLDSFKSAGISALTYDDSTLTYTAPSISTKVIPTIQYKENTQYTFILSVSNNLAYDATNLRIYYTDGTNTLIKLPSASAGTKQTVVFTTASGKTVDRIQGVNSAGTITLYYNESGLFEGVKTAQDFEPCRYIYGGELNLTTGVLTVDRQGKTLDGTEDWQLQINGQDTTVFKLVNAMTVPDQNNQICSHFTYNANANTASSDRANTFVQGTSGNLFIQVPNATATTTTAFKAWLASNNVTYVARLSPTTIQLTPEEVRSFLGTNNLWANTGDTEVTYYPSLSTQIRMNDIVFSGNGYAEYAKKAGNVTWRDITVGGNSWKGTGTDTGALNFVQGSNVTLTNSGNDLTIAATDTTYTGTGVISVDSSTHVISTTAEVNQNAFSNVKVGSTTIAADSKTDTLELVAGSNVTLTPDATNDKVTIAATDTTYSDATSSASGLLSSTGQNRLFGTTTSERAFQQNGVAPLWASGTSYTADSSYVTYVGLMYRCILDHTASADNSPGSSNADTYWAMQRVYALATEDHRGYMSNSDKTKLNAIPTNGYSDWAYISPSNVTNISGSAGNQRYLATITVPAHTLRLYDIAVDLTKGADGGQADLVISSTKGATTATGSTPSGADSAFQYTAKTIAPCPATGNFLIKLSTQIRNNTASSKTYQLNLRRYLGGTGSLTAVTRYSQIEYPA